MVAVYPIASGSAHNTNPSYSGTFIPELWSKKLNVEFYAKTLLPEIANLDWEGEIKSGTDTVNIRITPHITIHDYVIGGAMPTPSMIAMTVNKGKAFRFAVNDVHAAQSDLKLMDEINRSAAFDLAEAVETEVFEHWFLSEGAHAANRGATAGKLSRRYNLGTDVAPVDRSSPDAVLGAILEMAGALDEQNVPREDRWLLMTPADHTVLARSKLADVSYTGDNSSAARTGKVGNIAGMNVYVSTLLPRGAAGKALVGGNTDLSTGAAIANAKDRHMMVAGHKKACAFAGQITKTEELRNHDDFGNLVRALKTYGRKVVKPEALVTALVGATA